MKKIVFMLFAIATISIASAQIPTNGLVSYYPFNGNANDTISSNNGTVNGATLTTDRFGNPNSAYNFKANQGNNISIPTNTFHFSNYTYSFWINMSKLPNSGDRSVIMSIGGMGGDQGVSINNDYFGGVEMFDGVGSYSSGSTAIYTNGPGLDTGSWYHIVSVRDTNYVKTYINGQLAVTSQSSMGALPGYGSSSFGARIGSRFNATLAFNGKIDEVRIYNRGLDSNEVMALYLGNECICTIYDTVVVYDTMYVAVSDTLLIDAVLSGVNPPSNKNQIKIYPNPSKDYVFIDNGDFSLMNNYSLKIINAAGQEVFASNINQKVFQVNLSTLTGKGTYFVMLYDPQNNLMEVKKIVLQ